MFRDAYDVLYSDMYSRGRWAKVWSKLTGRSRRLLSLAEVSANCTVRNRCYAGTRTVPIDRIRGSENRTEDFDRDFHPLKSYGEQRWMGVARARLAGKALPPVELIQVEDVYFVRDGHHRISVARSMGQVEVDAEVTVWQVAGRLLWEKPAADGGSRLGRSWRSLLTAVGLKPGARVAA